MERPQKTLTTMLQRLKETLERVEQKEQNIKLFPNNPGMQNSLFKEKLQLIGRARYLGAEIRDLVDNGKVVLVKYSVDSTLYSRYFTNMSGEEATSYLLMRAKIQGLEVEIIECHELITKNSVSPL